MRKGCIFDLDNTLYPDPQGRNRFFFEAAVRAVSSLAGGGANAVQSGDVPALVQKSLDLYRSEQTLFYQDMGFNRAALFDAYHREAFEIFHREGSFLPDDEVVDLFARVPDLNAVIVTHGSRYWAENIVDNLGLSHVFTPDRVIALNDPEIGFLTKDKSSVPFQRAMSVLGTFPADTTVVEDSHANLVIPSAMGMRTVLVDWGSVSADKKHPHILESYPTVKSFLKSLDDRPSSSPVNPFKKGPQIF